MPLASSAELRGTRRCPRTSRRRRAASPSRTLTRPGTDPPGSESPAEPQPVESRLARRRVGRDSPVTQPATQGAARAGQMRCAATCDAGCGLQALPRVSVAGEARRRRSILGRGLVSTSPRRLVPTSPSILGGGLAGAKRSRRGRQRLAAGRFPSHRPRPRRPGLAVSRRRFRVTRRVSESRGVFPDFFESPATPRAPATHGRPRRLIRLGFDSDSTRAGPPAGSPGEALPGPSATGRRAPHPPRKLRLRPTEPPSQPPPSQTAPVPEPPSQPGDSEPPSDGQDRRWRRLSQL